MNLARVADPVQDRVDPSLSLGGGQGSGLRSGLTSRRLDGPRARGRSRLRSRRRRDDVLAGRRLAARVTHEIADELRDVHPARLGRGLHLRPVVVVEPEGSPFHCHRWYVTPTTCHLLVGLRGRSGHSLRSARCDRMLPPPPGVSEIPPARPSVLERGATTRTTTTGSGSAARLSRAPSRPEASTKRARICPLDPTRVAHTDPRSCDIRGSEQTLADRRDDIGSGLGRLSVARCESRGPCARSARSIRALDRPSTVRITHPRSEATRRPLCTSLQLDARYTAGRDRRRPNTRSKGMRSRPPAPDRRRSRVCPRLPIAWNHVRRHARPHSEIRTAEVGIYAASNEGWTWWRMGAASLDLFDELRAGPPAPTDPVCWVLL